MNRIVRFALKPTSEKQTTIHFFSRMVLAKLPFVPVRTRLQISPKEALHFWWSYVPIKFHADRSLCDYWGEDCGELRFLWRFLEPGMTFFDVGAFHGVFSVLAGLKLSGKGRVVAFEPSPRERRRFELHRRMNGLAPMRLEPYAVSGGVGPATFFTIEKGFTSMNSLQRPAIDQPVEALIVDRISLDEYLSGQDIRAIDLMKMDVEGGELEAFHGAENMLHGIRPLLICEVLDWVTRPWGYEAREIVGYLQAKGYKWFDFCDDGSLQPHELRDAYPEIRNYLAVPREKIGMIERWCSA